jgi:hypothetical protein
VYLYFKELYAYHLSGMGSLLDLLRQKYQYSLLEPQVLFFQIKNVHVPVHTCIVSYDKRAIHNM